MGGYQYQVPPLLSMQAAPSAQLVTYPCVDFFHHHVFALLALYGHDWLSAAHHAWYAVGLKSLHYLPDMKLLPLLSHCHSYISVTIPTYYAEYNHLHFLCFQDNPIDP